MNNILNVNRKILCIVLCVVFVFVLALTIVYAALATTLNISGNAEVIASNWDIYLDNVQLMSGSVNKDLPIINDKRTVSFSVNLINPGDYYMFTVDVVNNGSIDAMIDGIVKTPELSVEQAKYLNYEVLYQNGDYLNTKQVVEKGSFVRLKVKVEFRKDISSSSLPTNSETLNLSFSINYTQASETGLSNVENNGKYMGIVSGDYDTIGSEICIGEEYFYVIGSDEESVIMLAKYNLYAGGEYNRNSSIWVSYGSDATYRQDSLYCGSNPATNIIKGSIAFSSNYYWKGTVSSYPSYVYNSNSNIYESLQKYKVNLEENGVFIKEVRLIEKEELDALGCDISSKTCVNSIYKWLYTTSYWTGTAYNEQYVYRVRMDGVYSSTGFSAISDSGYGIRPVIIIDKL